METVLKAKDAAKDTKSYGPQYWNRQGEIKYQVNELYEKHNQPQKVQYNIGWNQQQWGMKLP